MQRVKDKKHRSIKCEIFFWNITEFDNWYSESFLNQAEEPQTSQAAGHGVKPGIFIPYKPEAMVRI